MFNMPSHYLNDREAIWLHTLRRGEKEIMEIFVIEGYFSVVQDKYCRHDELMVRARDVRDLKALAEHMTLGPVLETPDLDFPVRAIATRSNWAGFLAMQASYVHYESLEGFVSSLARAGTDVPQERSSALSALRAAIKNTYEGITS